MAKNSGPIAPDNQDFQAEINVSNGQSYQMVRTTTFPVGVSPWARLGARLLETLLSIVTLYIGWLIWAAIIAKDGYTPAKKILGQRVVDKTGAPVGFSKMFFMRGIVAGFLATLLLIVTVGLITFMPFWDKRNQNIWDKVSGTLVVDDQLL